MTDQNLHMAQALARSVAAAGGRAYYVGGFVRDRLLGQENKDIDIEVHGITAQTLEAILDSLGERTQMGVSFGVYGLRHYDIDIAMPRMEKATGRGHRDFAVYTDPFLGTKKAAQRRDFTINAMMEDVLTGEIIDHFNGKDDLQRGILRHVNDASFPEDPLRVLRAAQFAARFKLNAASETISLCRCMNLSSLASERIFTELEKALLKAERPSIFFETLRQMNQLHTWFPEAEALIDIPQEPKHHPEGSVWNHTMLVLNQAAALRDQAAEPLPFMLSALCHDFGKVSATAVIDGVIRSLNHETMGLPLVQRFLSRLTNETKLHKYVLNMTQLHMRPNALFRQQAGVKAYNRLFDLSVCPRDLLLLAKADSLGRALEMDYSKEEACLSERLSAFEVLMAHPRVMGADLIAAGFTPGKDFGEALAFAHKMHLSGVSKESALHQTIALLRKQRSENSASR